MQKWEYMFLGVVKSYGINYRANGEKIGDWKDVPMHEVFNRLGKAGFEFAYFDGDAYIFKRPINSSNGNTRSNGDEPS